ncbi:hypothetical protein [Chlorobaculum sp. 24CR]
MNTVGRHGDENTITKYVQTPRSRN